MPGGILPCSPRYAGAARTLAAVLILGLLGCPGDDDDDTTAGDDDVALPWSAGDRFRLAPEAGNNVGLFDLAWCPGHDELLFSNLHHPHLGLVEPDHGTLAAVVDLREATGGAAPVFPFLACHPPSGTVLVNDRRGGALLRVDPAARAVTQVAPVCDEPGWVEVDPDAGEVFVVCAGDGTIARLDADLQPLDTFDPQALAPSRLHLSGGRLFVIDEIGQKLGVLDPASGALLGAVQLDGWPNLAVRRADGQLWVTDRLGGRAVRLGDGDPPTLIDDVAVGSDAYGILDVPARDRIYVVARQGADLQPGETYQGEPGLVVELAPGGGVTDTIEVGKTPHFAAYDQGRDRLYVGNEDSLDVTALGPYGTSLWDPPELGLTLDDVAVDAAGGALWFPSHLTDELRVVNGAGEPWTSVDVPSWPFAVALDEDARRVYVASHQRADLRAYDADTHELVEVWGLVDGGHGLPCSPLCTGHPIATDVALDPARGFAYVSHPPHAAVLRVDLATGFVATIPLSAQVDPGPGDKFQHMALQVDPADGRVFVYFSLEDRLFAIDGEAVVAEATVDCAEPRPLSLDPARDRVLIGREVLDRDLQPLDTAPAGLELVGVLTEPDRYLARDADRVVLLDPDTLDEAGALALDQLQVPPFLIDDPTTPGALRSSPVYAVPLAGGPLVLLVNVFEGTAEVVEARDW